MSLRDLSGLFRPRSIAVIGSETPEGVAAVRNLAAAKFEGTIALIGDGPAPEGFALCPSIEALAAPVNLALICAPIDDIPPLLVSLAAKGIRAAIILSGSNHSEAPALAAAEIRLAARKLGIRLIGPDSFGIVAPGRGLNASIMAGAMPRAGGIGLVAQSASLAAAAIDRSRALDIGFSAIVGLGPSLDVDFGDALDTLGSDPETRAILMIVESIHERREFVAAARAAARNKPILAMKVGARGEAIGESGSHSGRMVRAAAVYEAVFRRAGILLAEDLRELFMAASTLARIPALAGDLTIFGNGRGIGMVAADELARRGGYLADLDFETLDRLESVALAGMAANPLDLGLDAPPEKYGEALDILLDAPETETILAMHASTALADPVAAAEATIGALKGRRTPVLACWTGTDRAAEARAKLIAAGLPTYDSPVDALRAFMHLVNHRRRQDLLMETPASALDQFRPDSVAARKLVAGGMGQLRFGLAEPEAKALLDAYGIESVRAEIARDPAEAGRIAGRLGGHVALKILSPDIAHKTAFGGVVLDLPGAFETEKAGHVMLERIAKALPAARIDGFAVQPMARRPGAVEILIGVATDPVFGPLILFGQGGTAVEAIGDIAIGMPPLNMALARELIGRSRVMRLLQGGFGRPPADLDAVCLALMKVSQMVVDIPELFEMDINPLFADAAGVIALDARVALAPAPEGARLAIHPYPQELEEIVVARDGQRILLRPIRPEDEPNHHVLIARTTKSDLRFRFFSAVGEVPHSQMARLTQIDYVREMAFVAVPADEPGRETLGVVRSYADADNDTAEFAILVRSDLKGAGIGRLLMQKMIGYRRAKGLRRLIGEVLSENHPMLKLGESLGFRRAAFGGSDSIEVEMVLR